jgi:penicillin-insensitive murein endopeptidase
MKPLLAILLVLVAFPATAQQAARDLFGAVALPSSGAPAPVGSYARGCLAGGVQLADDGPGWQSMRLSRNRHWGHPSLIAYIQWLAEAVRQDGWNGLLVGDLSQPRGGPMKGGHASHQTGLDVDLWLEPMPATTLSAAERETKGAQSVLIQDTRTAYPQKFTRAHAIFVARAALHPDVERVFVAAGIKEIMCSLAWQDRGFLRKVRPWYGHDDHIHVRLGCPAGATGCTGQSAPPVGDGCGEELAWWLSDEPYKPSTQPPAPPLTLADLPNACAGILADD